MRVLTINIKPLQLIAAAIQQGTGQPVLLTTGRLAPHHFALRPSDVRVADIDLLYWVGPDLEGFLPRVLAGRDKPSVAVQGLPGMTLRHFGQAAHGGDDTGRQ